MTKQKLVSETQSLGMNREAVKNGFNYLKISWGTSTMSVPLSNTSIAMGITILDAVQGDCEYVYV